MATNAGRRLMIGIRGKELDSGTRRQIEDIRPGAVILFSRNIESPQQLRGLVKEIKSAVSPPPLIAIDQEGGLVVCFFKDLAIMAANMALGAARSRDLACRQGIATARELKDLGIDINLAPVVDVVTGYDNPGITIRSFGSGPDMAAELGSALAGAMQSQGIAAVAKHFPGKGGAVKDAHVDLPRVDISWGDLQRIHLAPFAACIRSGIRGVMSSHVIYGQAPGADCAPATFSRELIDGVLRQAMGFRGVVFSDDLEMGAIAQFFPFKEAVLKAAQAGHDMLLVCSDYEKQRIARDILAEAGKRDSSFAEEGSVSEMRIDDLGRFCSQQLCSAPEDAAAPESAGDLAAEIARRSITVLNAGELLPIPAAMGSIAAIVPDLKDIESREEGFESGDNNVIVRALKKRFPGRIDPLYLTPEATESEVLDALARARKASLIVAFVFNARYSSSQRLLIESVQQLGTPSVLVLIRNPFDLEYVNPGVPVIISYGYRIVQMEAAVALLDGSLTARGELPFAMWPYS